MCVVLGVQGVLCFVLSLHVKYYFISEIVPVLPPGGPVGNTFYIIVINYFLHFHAKYLFSDMSYL